MDKFSLRLTCLVCVFCTMAAVATPTDTFTTLAEVYGRHGRLPAYGNLVQGLNGNFYGTTLFGGLMSSPHCLGNVGCGTVFEITPAGRLTTLYSFGSQSGDGLEPFAGLVQATNGNFYGTTLDGGANNYGTVFEITPAGEMTTLYSFGSQLDDGTHPKARLVQATNGNFYGTTLYGGANRDGTVFEITPAGEMTTLYSFCSQTNCTDGEAPTGELVQATDGNFYGTTSYVREHNVGGTIFEITSRGMLTTLYNFCFQSVCSDPVSPYGGLLQATNGIFYGTTAVGGSVFSLATGLGPFVETLPSSRKVGAAVKILGNNLTGTTSVTFNGTPAAFTVVLSTEITATVPSGATTGKVEVTTPSTVLTSNVDFRVMPTIASFLPTSGPVGRAW